MSWAVIQHQATYELGLRGGPVLHLHNLDHMEINRVAELILRIYDCRLGMYATLRCGPGAPFEGGGGLIARTASTTEAANCFARVALSFVARDVWATLTRVARSSSIGCLNLSKNYTQKQSTS